MGNEPVGDRESSRERLKIKSQEIGKSCEISNRFVRDGKSSCKRLEMELWKMENGVARDERRSSERWEEK